jgi:hypothetical protein
MRRGPIDRYPVASVLVAAAEAKADGIVEVESSIAGRVYLDRGAVALATLHGVPDPYGRDDADRVGRDVVFEHCVAAVASLLTARGGFYHHNPIATHPAGLHWRFPVDDVLDAARRSLAESAPLGRWSGRPIRVGTTAHPEVRLSQDAWNVVVAMTVATPAQQLRRLSGFDASRVASTLDELESAGLLATAPAADDRDLVIVLEDGAEPTVWLDPPSPGRGQPPADAAVGLPTEVVTDASNEQSAGEAGVPSVPTAADETSPEPNRRRTLHRLINSLRA